MTRVLITGGAGFIGAHLAAELLRCGYAVRILDSLVPQVHGPDQRRPTYLPSAAEVELIVGDVRDPEAVGRALEGVDGVFHLAALVGVGQSMYRVADYTTANGTGTAVLLEALAARPVMRLVVASSMSVYGEGLYRDAAGRVFGDVERTEEQLRAGRWDPIGPRGEVLEPIATPESKPPSLASVYALSKFDQERLCLLLGRARGTPVTALRLFNVYGPHQALSNPYTGVLAIFASRLLNEQPPLIYEDGLQRRDFVHVRDVARAFRLAFEEGGTAGRVLNVGSGEAHSIREIAALVATAMKRDDLPPEVTAKFRVGDIRHCFADITAARTAIGYRPEIKLRDGLIELAQWLDGQIAVDRFAEAQAELVSRGLFR